MTLMALTIRQPYSGLIAAGLKLVENRAARTSIRGPVAIHSAKAVDFPELHKQIAAGAVAPFTVLGSVLAVADLTGCHEADQDSPATCCGEYGMRTYSGRPAIHLGPAGLLDCARRGGAGDPTSTDPA